MKEYKGFIMMDVPDDDFSLYQMTSSFTDDLSIYIGVTGDYKQRCKTHAHNRFSKNLKDSPLYKWINNVIDGGGKIHFKLLENNLSESKAFAIEQEKIKAFREAGFILLNSTDGGKGTNGLRIFGQHFTEERRQKISTALKGRISPLRGKKHSEEVIERMRNAHKKLADEGQKPPNRKKAYKYDLFGNLLTIYDSASEASRNENYSLQSISDKCTGRRSHYGLGFIWFYEFLSPEQVIEFSKKTPK